MNNLLIPQKPWGGKGIKEDQLTGVCSVIAGVGIIAGLGFWGGWTYRQAFDEMNYPKIGIRSTHPAGGAASNLRQLTVEQMDVHFRKAAQRYLQTGKEQIVDINVLSRPNDRNGVSGGSTKLLKKQL